MQHITLIATGGTIEKVYVEQTGELTNRGSIVRRMLSRLRLEDIRVSIIELMSKDSLHMTDEDREKILAAVSVAMPVSTGVVVLHGTDTLTLTGELLAASLPSPPVPIILTGAMRPYEMKRSDALQNLTESMFAAEILPPAVYCVAHGRALQFPGVTKDHERGTFIRAT